MSGARELPQRAGGEANDTSAVSGARELPQRAGGEANDTSAVSDAREPPQRGGTDIRLAAWGITGLAEIQPGDDLAASLAERAPGLADGDIMVITSKAVSKAEGRVRTGERDSAVEAETARVVAQRGGTRIVETHHGFILAAAGVDASNTEPGTVVLLPADPDASARHIRAGLRERLGVTVAVIVSDTFGRPWRRGLTDVAVGAAGIDVLDDLRDEVDSHGNRLDVTVTAAADELAGAAELVKGKLAGVPAAVIRGAGERVTVADGAGVAPMLRPAAEDMFRYGSREVVTARRTVWQFRDHPVDPAALRRAVSAAVTAPAPHHCLPWRFVFVESADARKRLVDALLTAWMADLRADGVEEEAIPARTRRGNVLLDAPHLVVPCLVRSGAHEHVDSRRQRAERETFLLAMGAGVENMLVALAAEGLGSCWTPSTMFCPDVAARELDLPPEWEPMGAVGIGHPAGGHRPHPPRDPNDFLTVR